MERHDVVLDYRDSHLERGEIYDRELAEEPFDGYLARREAEIVPALVARLFPAGVPRYLDFACGTGRIARLLEPLARESYGIDISPGMLEQARQKCSRTAFVLCDVTREDPGLAPFPLVTAFRFFGNAQDELRRAALGALAGLVAEGGYLVLNDHCNPCSLRNLLLRLRGDRLPGYQGRPVNLHYWKLKRLLAEFGFRPVWARGIGWWVYRYALMRTEVLESRFGRALEPLARLGPLVPFCPDILVAARRVAGRR